MKKLGSESAKPETSRILAGQRPKVIPRVWSEKEVKGSPYRKYLQTGGDGVRIFLYP